ncbi:MAG: dihydroneopterin aldolase [Planctomycetaceae bacterium]
MSDRIDVHDLLIRTIIGINDEERIKPQDVVVCLSLWADMRRAGETDEIEDAVNYRTVTKQVIELVEGSQFYLVEKLATEIAKVCLLDSRIEQVRVTVEKPGAVRFARTVGVTIERSQGFFSR